ncbi:RNA methyltransferase [Halarchaeum sp. CBA1220]|uniref:RNA methyltransferase n=1 Tax=Halarchaeum grantii TaxID=1193105 RepID=A0A830F4X5_9EURY|nr:MULTISPECIES: RNA methyltransferase [Halarchaeum]QLC34323.1 RNA methyltransferase [Halarchaeum sp. CBA1220]GGL21444.1 RNA methyltransferase [Halarchaeum grantii]
MGDSAPAVAVVDAETPGNVGTIARAMKNFGFSDLYLVDPPDLSRESEAYGFAGQAREDILPEAEEVEFDYLVENFHTVGFTAITNEDATKHVRFPFRTPDELAGSLRDVEAPTCLVFGRERVGLHNSEMERLDEISSIPASADYPVLNLGQAATVALYELRELTVDETQLPDVAVHRAKEEEIEAFYDHFADFLELVDYPEEKQAKTGRMVRRILGRAHPTGREVNTLHGILRRARWHIEGNGRKDSVEDEEY